MTRILGFLASVAILAVTAVADAGHQCVVQTQAVVATPVVAAQIVTPFVATTFLQIPYPNVVAVPTYSVSGYYGNSQRQPEATQAREPSQCEQTGAAIKDLAAALSKSNDLQAQQNAAILDFMRRGPQIPQPLPAGPPSPGIQPRVEPVTPAPKTSTLSITKGATYVARCAQCHDKAVIDAKSADPNKQPILFLNKQPVPLSGDMAFACLDSISRGDMPKGQEITEAEFVDIQGTIRELRITKAVSSALIGK